MADSWRTVSGDIEIIDGIKRTRYVSLSQLGKAIARLSKKYENSTRL